MLKEIKIENPGFEEGFYNFQGIGEMAVAKGWTPYWKRGSPEEVAEGHFKRPEYRPEDTHLGHKRVKEGRYAQKFTSTFATHDAGIYQRVAVPHDAELFLTAYLQFWSWDPKRNEDGGYAGRVGIDPFGETDPFSDSVVWGEWHGVYDPDGWDGSTWQQVTAKAQARGPYATLFLNGACLHRVKFNDSYWDSIQLYAVVEDGVPDGLKEKLEQIYALLGAVIEEID